MDETDGNLDRLRGQKVTDLQAEWLRRLGTPPPELRSAIVLAQLLAWRIQEREHGGLDPNTKARLRRLAKGRGERPERQFVARPKLTPGTTLVKEWQGTPHHVRVTEAGFEYAGSSYGSLSEVARAITGTRWSGPRFFGLTKKAAS